MNRLLRHILPAALGACIAAGCGSGGHALRSGSASIRYEVSIPDPSDEVFAVTARLSGIERDTIRFEFPVWAPGAYDVVNFGRYVSGFTASTPDGRTLQVVRPDTNTFLIIGRARSITLRYRVADIEWLSNAPWFGLSDIEPGYAYANAVALFGYPQGFKEIPYTVVYRPPTGWDLAVSLPPAAEPGAFIAGDYDQLVDAPVQMGSFQRFNFEYRGKPHTITVTAPDRVDPKEGARLAETTKEIVRVISEFFDEVPYDRYLFQTYLVDLRKGGPRPPYGALEHSASSTYLLPYYGGDDISAILRPIMAHEYWHVWFPKRAHVWQLGPFDYQTPPRTTSLWFAEGLTEYYSRVLLVRNRMLPWDSFLGEMARDIGKLYGQPQLRSITELSRDIFELPVSDAIDLYSKGPVIGLLLDAEIRLQTRNSRSLDDAMRYFEREYGRSGRTFSDEEIIPIMERATGAELKPFYRRYVAGREMLPLDALIPKIGLRYQQVQQTRMSLGAEVEQTAKGLKIMRVIPGGSADSMRLRAGDVLTKMGGASGRDIALDQIAIGSLDDLIGAVKPVTFRVLRGSTESLIMARIIPTIAQVRVLRIDQEATGLAAEIRKSMFGF